MTFIVKKVEGRRKGKLRIGVLLVLLALPFALAVNGAGGGGGVAPNSEFTLDGDLTTREVILASSTITGSKHDFTYNATLTPKGECSACHNVRIGEPFLWTRSLTEEEAYFNQTSNPNYLVSPTIYCYDCHDNHVTVDNDPNYRFFINESLGRYIPQDVAFDSNLTDKLAYNSTPLDDSIGFYETAPPNSAPWTDGRPTGGHYIKSDPAGLTNINRGDKLPCTDCHEPHNSEPTNEVFLRGSAYFPLGGRTVSNLKASTKTRSGTGTGRAICTNCHGYNDTGTPVRFVDINAAYGSTDTIVQTPTGVIEHVSTNTTACTDCHTHDSNCGKCHGSPPYDQSHVTHYFEVRGPALTTCLDCHLFGTGTHKDGNVNFRDGAAKNLTTTAACDTCHSPDGAFDGVNDTVIGAKPNWASGIYNGSALKVGKEQWCAGCHDDAPAYSKTNFVETVVDNLNATFVGTWSSSTSSQHYGTNFRYHNAGDGTSTTTWTPDLPRAGEYSIYAWWVDGTNRATNAPYTISYAGGTETVEVNQKLNGGKWNYLGTYNFAAGTAGSVKLTDGANGLVVADAIKFESGNQATFAPNVTGDNTSYGFYVTGHKIDCLSCHNVSKEHIDGEHRTYEADETTKEAINPYGDSYRLKDIDGVPALNLPRKIAHNNPHTDWQDFALCFNCHDRYEVLGETKDDVSHTNFWNNDATPDNSHWIHLTMDSAHFDSDWDSTVESRESCIACHNVHGAPRGPMLRHGELISPAGTMRYVPAFNFFYLVAGDGSATATFTPTLAGGTYDVYAWWSTHANRARNAKYVIYHDGGQAEVTVNQEQNGSQWNLLGRYTITTANGSVVLTSDGADQYIMADGIQWNRTDGGDTVYLDDLDATYVGVWTNATTPQPTYYNNTTHYYYALIRDPNASVTESFGATMYSSGSLGGNHICQACHGYVEWFRDPFTGPRIPQGNADPNQVSNFEATSVLFTAYVTDADDNIIDVVVDLSSVGGSIDQTMYDNGTHGDVTADDGTYSIQFTVPSGIDEGPKSLQVTATDADNQMGEGFIQLTVTEPGAIIIDNPEATFVGTWPESTGGTGIYGANYQYHEKGSGSNTATWNFSIAAVGYYEVYAWWVASSNRATNAPYTINYEGGNETVRVSQHIKGGTWTYLGNYSFGVGNYSVVLSDDANNYVIADAIKITPESPPPFYPWPISDNPQADYVGAWLSTAGDDRYGSDYYYHPSVGTGLNTAIWTLAVPEAGTYNVYAWWDEGSNRPADAPYTINYEGGSDTVTVCQQIRGGQWNYLGNYPYNAGNYAVMLSDNATTSTYIIADALKFEKGVPPANPYPIADNWNATFVGPWQSYSGANEYGSDFQYLDAGTGINATTWTIAVPSAGNYSVYAWWTEYTNRATDAPYTISYEGGNETVRVSQQIKGGQWNYLGTYPFIKGNYTVVLTDDADGRVVADAIKFDPAPYTPTSVWPISDNLDAEVAGHWQSSTWGTQYYGSDYYYYPAVGGGTGENTVTWSLAVPATSNYNVYARWVNSSNRAADAPYTISYEGGSETVEVCQHIRGGRWNYLGNYPFNAGNYTVTLSDNVTYFPASGNYVTADAIKFEIGGPPPYPYPIADNWNATVVGPWGGAFWTGGGAIYGEDYQYKYGSDGSNTVTWRTAIPEQSTYSVYTRWSAHSTRPTNAPYTISYAEGSAIVTVDQTKNGGKWMYLGSYPFNAGSYSVVLSDNVPSNKVVIADAIKWEKGLVLDDPDASFTGTWTVATAATDQFNISYRYHAAGTGSNNATWTPNITTAGNYSVYAWWSADTDRATDAPYTITYDGGSETIDRNQTQDGGQWNLLGTYPFAEGTSGSVVLSDDANGVVIADAVRFEQITNISWLSPTAIHCSNLSNASALIDNNNLTGNTLDSGTEQYVVFDLGSNYTVTSIRMYTDGNSYTWNVSMGNDTTNPSCCNYSDWGTLVIEDWQTPSGGWTETELATPTTARYLKLMRNDGSGDLIANSLFEFRFDPPAAKLTYELHSYADLHIYDPANRHVGMKYATGELENLIPGAISSFGEVQAVSLPKLAVGEYRVILKGTGTGDYELVVKGESACGGLVSETFSRTIKKDEIHDATTAVNTAKVMNITITVDEPPEPTVQMVGVANVTLAGLYPAIDNVDVEKITLGAVDTTSMPEAVEAVQSVYMVNATGSGTFVLRFDDVEHADEITAVYKIDHDGSWMLLPFTVNGATVEVTLEAGDPPVVFASVASSLTLSPPGAALHVGETNQFTANARDPYGMPSAGSTVTWTSTTEAIGTFTPVWNLTGADGATSTTFTATAVGTTRVKATNDTVNVTARVRVLPDGVNVVGEETRQVESTVPPKAIFTEVSTTVEGISFTQGDGEVTVIVYDANPTGIDPVSTGDFDCGFGHFSVDVDSSLNSTVSITFTVPLADLDAASLAKNTDIMLYQFSGGVWNELPTTYIGDVDGMYARYNATVSHFSDFAIGGKAIATPMPTPLPTPTPSPAAGGGGPGGPLPAYLLPSPTPTPTETLEEGDSKTTTAKPIFNFMSPPGVTSPQTATPSPTATSTATPVLRHGEAIPGFEGLFAVIGLLAIAYLVQKRKEHE